MLSSTLLPCRATWLEIDFSQIAIREQMATGHSEAEHNEGYGGASGVPLVCGLHLSPVLQGHTRQEAEPT